MAKAAAPRETQPTEIVVFPTSVWIKFIAILAVQFCGIAGIAFRVGMVIEHRLTSLEAKSESLTAIVMSDRERETGNR